MKKIFIPLVAVFAISCGGEAEKRTDSVEMAKDVNRSIDSTQTPVPDGLDADKTFVVEAASGGLMEVQLGKYAAVNGGSAVVKQFGQMMVTDHGKADSLLTSMAQAKGIAIPSAPGEKHQHHINELTKKKGSEFDKDYMKMMVEDHEEDVKKFEEAANNAKDPDVKAFATQTLPVLKKHLEQAKKIREGLK